jgi:hypothetical protein
MERGSISSGAIDSKSCCAELALNGEQKKVIMFSGDIGSGADVIISSSCGQGQPAS